MCHDMCKCFGRVGENREGMETGDAGREGGDAAICVALVKGETQIAVDIGKRTFISIHAPAKGATRPLTRPSSSARYFNPRSREGSDSDHKDHDHRVFISIHAPVKGATDGGLHLGGTVRNISIHAPVKGATQSEIDKLPEVKFQSTLPRVLRTRP